MEDEGEAGKGLQEEKKQGWKMPWQQDLYFSAGSLTGASSLLRL